MDRILHYGVNYDLVIIYFEIIFFSGLDFHVRTDDGKVVYINRYICIISKLKLIGFNEK